ncbi:MAG: dethiobiotin synthase [Nevskiaceae bacterium]|nr:MAG: dethiobiotin synthase [Nevskiaceae bacterium]
MAARTIFVTGTDTGVGKTYVVSMLLRQLRAAGVDACGFKPVASGCEDTPQGLRNEDALALQAASGGTEPYEALNPYALAPAIAPHLAARDAGVRVDCSRLDAAQAALAARHDLVLVEGAGGWQVPLNEAQTFADWVTARQWPVLLVVGMRLGCINHALLSADSIARGTRLLAWVANVLPPAMPYLDDNIATLRARLPAPLLGVIPAGGSTPLDLAPLLTGSPAARDTRDAAES